MTTFVHNIGGFYTPARFIREAREHGAHRRVAQHLLGRFNFGDRVMTLDWRHGHPEAFGEFIIETISFQAEVMARLARQVVDEGEADLRPALGNIMRECGSYADLGGITVRPESRLTLPEIVARAKRIAAELGIPKLITFIGGRFTAYATPVPLEGRPPNQRGFWEWAEPTRRIRITPERHAIGIGDYTLRTRVARQDVVQLELGDEPTL